MTTATRTSKRKVFNLKEDTYNALAAMAARRGDTFNVFVSKVLDDIVEDYEDRLMYEQLLETDPEGKIKLSEAEKKDFESWLGV